MNQRRGQTMLLLVLTMFLLALMVCMTLSFGTKIKEKMETQAVADASAYTNAVITARSFNAVSLTMNAGLEALAFQGAVDSLQKSQWDLFAELIGANLLLNQRDKQILKGVKSGAQYPNEWDAPGFGYTNMREVGAIDVALDFEHIPLPSLPFGGAYGGGGAATSVRWSGMKRHHVSAVMGSRG